MSEPTADIALLAPVPLEHLISGLETSRVEGFAAFGSDAAEVLAELALLSKDHPADVLFFASRTSTGGKPSATFRARFVDYDGARSGKAKPDWLAYRPESTFDRWELAGLLSSQRFVQA